MVEKLEITVNEYNIKMGDMNRARPGDVRQKQRKLPEMESSEASKKLNEDVGH